MKTPLAKMALAFLLLLISMPSFAQPTEPAYSLDECFTASLKQSEAIAIQKEFIVQTEERYRQAIGRVLPLVEGKGTQSWQEQAPENIHSKGVDAFTAVWLTASQPIFHGFREFAFIRENKALRKSQEYDWQQASRSLYLDVARNFYVILSLEQEIVDVQGQIDAEQERIKDLKQRVNIGRSRSSEVLTVQASHAQLLAEKERIRGQLAVERETFRFLTGLSESSQLNDTSVLETSVEPLEAFQTRLDTRPDIQAEMSRLKAANESTKVAWGAHSPSLDAKGNYFIVNTRDMNDRLQESSWDATLELTIPIFSGGIIQSQVREAKSRVRQADLTLQQRRRIADEETRALHRSYTSNIDEVRSLREAVRLSKSSYDVSTKDYRLGLLSNIDVLQVLTAYKNTLRTLNRTIFASKLNRLQLDVASMNKSVETYRP